MNWKLIALPVAALVLSGCSLLQEEPVKAEERIHDADAVVRWRVGQMDAVRDGVSGDLVHVFCKQDECVVSGKTITVQPPRRPGMDVAGRQQPREVTEVARPESVFSIPFDYDKATINDRGAKALAEISASLMQSKGLKVVGLADSVNRDKYNLSLAKRRADAVGEWLKKRFAEAGKSIQIESDARVVKVTEDGVYPPGEKFKGRRVDLTVLILEVK